MRGLGTMATFAMLLPACAGGAAPGATTATTTTTTMTTNLDWNGPAVHSRHLGDGGLQIELIAPTAGHTFQLERVERDAAAADVFVRYAAPTADLVAQVVTTLPVEVGAAQLGDATAVRIWVERAGESPRMAIATARPPR